MFGTILISTCTVMHVYVFWRSASVPFISQHIPLRILFGLGLILWATFVLGRFIGHGGTGFLAKILEFIGMNWMAVLFLIFIPLIFIDLITLFGFLFPRLSSVLRGWALVVGMGFSLIAMIQGLRSPVVEKYDVSLPGFPQMMDGTVIVALSDMHLGSLLDEDWLNARIAQVEEQEPDLVVLLGDIFEGHGPPDDKLISAFKQLSAPLGVWAVTGNHEFHGGGSMTIFKELDIRLLRNEWVEIKPGFILAGVDDLTTQYRRGKKNNLIVQALSGRPSGSIILFSHTPWDFDSASKEGVGLMLSGHTHGGQIWPFDFLVRSRYPLLEGRYDIDEMQVIVSRGAGTWGPRMRLWHPGEILCVTLRSKERM